MNNRSEIYVKPDSNIESGLINDSDIYHESDTIPDDATLFTLVFDTSQNTQGYQSVSTTLNLNLIGINGPDKYFGIQDSIKFGVIISWF